MLDGLKNWLGVGRSAPSAGYLRQPAGTRDALIIGPNPPLRDAGDDVQKSWVAAASRAIDSIHNSGWIAGLVEQQIALMIGDGLRLNYVPDMARFGWDDVQTLAWARRVEARFNDWASNPAECDAGARYTLAQMQASAIRQWFATGEFFAEYAAFARPGAETRTKVRLLPSHWCSQKSNPFSGLKQGVFLDGHGATTGFMFEVKSELGGVQEIRKAARDFYGRPIVQHVFDGVASQVRGITIFAPILRTVRNYDQLTNATLTAKLIHAIFAATIESDYPTAEVFDALRSSDEGDQDSGDRFDDFLAQKVGWAKSVKIDLGQHGKIPHLMMGEKLRLHTSSLPSDAFESVGNFFLREIARCVGGSFADVTGDHRGESYASMKLSTGKQWPIILYRRRHIPQPFVNAAFQAWLEEDIDAGRTELPGGIDAFVANRAAICRAAWRGPARPVADEVKAAKAHEIYRNMGVVTDEMICADLGVDHDDVYEGRAKEKASRERYGIHGGITNGGTDVDALIGEETPQQGQG